MNYLVSLFDCVLFAEQPISIMANVKYKISNITNSDFMVFPQVCSNPFLLNLNRKSKNTLKVTSGNDNYFFLFPNLFNDVFVTEFNYGSHKVMITLTSELILTVDGELICEKNVENLKYSHFEILGELCLIYFEGVRNYIVVIKQKKLCFAEYYDECNVGENEKYFMGKLKDSINHGMVCHIKDKKFDSYLVYLDDKELKLKEDFVSFVFLDCIKAKNFLYANSLLCDDLKLEDPQKIATFFPEFDWFYPVSQNEFVLINKNTLSGIYAFNIENNKITNIMSR